MSTIKEITPEEHVLLRKNMYLGDVATYTEKNFIGYNINTKQLEQFKEITYSKELLKLFDEALTNAIDNIERSKKTSTPCNKIVVNITNDHFDVFNNGVSIPIKLQKSIDGNEYYVPELAFSHLHSSSNYDDSEDRKFNGQNGLGIKLLNIFSRIFIIQIVNNHKKYKQVFENNMSIINKPTIIDCDCEDSVTIRAYLDFSKFSDLKEIDKDNITRLTKRVYDSTISSAITLNKTLIPKQTFKQFATAHIRLISPESEILNFAEKNYELSYAFTAIKSKHCVFSYVNDNYTSDNGSHVKKFSKQFKEIMKVDDNPMNYSIVFLNQTVVNPKFTGQAKESLSSRIMTDYSNTINSIIKMTPIAEAVAGQNTKKINSKLNKRNPRFLKRLVKDADDANRRNGSCTLFVVEGNSAGSMVLNAIDRLPNAHEKYGVFCLIGKILNVAKAGEDKFINSPIVGELISAIGLSIGTQIPTNKLRYGKVVCVTDADTDGSHIKGLVINLFYEKFKYLIEENNFLYEFITPMIQVILNEKVDKTLEKLNDSDFSNYKRLEFYNKAEYQKALTKLSEEKILTTKYLKGLATIDSRDGANYFQNYEKHMLKYIKNPEQDTDGWMNVAFSNKRGMTQERKQWVESCDDKTFLPRTPGKPVEIAAFIEQDLVNYSYENCGRSIPSVYDGLKPTQRKILYTLFEMPEKKSKKLIKVSALQGKVMAKAQYHHGDQALVGTINNMQQSWTGSNNIPLLGHYGNIGSRAGLGKDGGQPRYVEVNLDNISRLIFPKDDDSLLEKVVEDEIEVEPKFYVPIIPLILINGCKGIGTGYSSSVPLHSQFDVCDYLHEFLENSVKTGFCNNFKTLKRSDVLKYVSKLIKRQTTIIKPYYPNYKGLIETVDNGYKSHDIHEWIIPSGKGFFERKLIQDRTGESPFDYDPCYLKISELPLDIGRFDVIKNLKHYLSGDKKKAISNKYWDYVIDFIDHSIVDSDSNRGNIEIYFKIRNTDGIIQTLPDFYVLPESNLLITSNMNLVNKDSRFTHYNNNEEILTDYLTQRYYTYILRKNKLVTLKEEELKYLYNKRRFIKGLIDDKIVVSKKPVDEVEEFLDIHKFDRKDSKFDYLLDIPVKYQTVEYYNKLNDETAKKESELDILINKPIEDIWKVELDKLETALYRHKEIIEKIWQKSDKSKKKN